MSRSGKFVWRRNHCGLEGFSLIEIVLAIGVISFAIVAIMGLFPIALRSAQESQRQTRAALIAQQLYSDIASVSGANRTVPTSTNSSVPINLASPNTFTFSYGQDGTLLGPGLTTDAIFRADVLVTPDVPTAGLSRVQTTVSSPAAAPTNSSGRSSYVFLTFFNRS